MRKFLYAKRCQTSVHLIGKNGNDRYTTQVVLRPYIGKLIGLTRVDQEVKNETDMPNERIAFKDVDDIDLGDIPF